MLFLCICALGSCVAFIALAFGALLRYEWNQLARDDKRTAKIALSICGLCGLVAGLVSLFFR